MSNRRIIGSKLSFEFPRNLEQPTFHTFQTTSSWSNPISGRCLQQRTGENAQVARGQSRRVVDRPMRQELDSRRGETPTATPPRETTTTSAR